MGGPRQGSAAFVGRDAERSRLQAALEDARRGAGRLILLAGEPGMGKTRLAEEVAREARQQGANVAWGRCWAEGGAPELWPWLQVIRSCLRAVDEETLRTMVGPHGGELTALVAPLQSERADLSATTGAPVARFRLFNAVAHFLDAYARLAPLVVILDDLHQADPPSLLLLQFFTQELRERSMLFVGTYREPAPTPNRALTRTVVEALREPGAERLVLAGLDERESCALVRALLEVEPEPALAADLHRWSGGIPLFLAECARQVRGRAGEPPAAAADLPIPDLLREVIEQRLASLSDDQRAVLRAAAQLNGNLTREALAEAVGPLPGASGDRIAAALAGAERLGVLVRTPDAGYRFAQAMVRTLLAAEAPAPSPSRPPPVLAPPPPAEPAVRPAADPTAAPLVFRKEGEFWTLCFGGRTGRIRDAKGLSYIALLLRHPGRETHVSELLSCAGGTSVDMPAGLPDADAPVRRGLGDAGVVLDARAKADYRRRLADLEEELAEAQRFNDRGRAERARHEIDLVTHELTAAIGLGGRDRRASSDVERARVNVTRSIARALDKVAESHPELAQHLARCIRTGPSAPTIPTPPPPPAGWSDRWRGRSGESDTSDAAVPQVR